MLKMQTAELAPERLAELIARFPHARIAVLGDFFLDKYLEVGPSLAEVSLETGKVAHQVVGIRTSPGAAGTVVCNLAALGAGHLHAIGYVGPDGEGFEMRRDLQALRCSTAHLIEAAGRRTPTYLKPRDATDPSLAGEHSRYDTKNRTRTPAELEALIVGGMDALLPDLDALIVMDQAEEEDCGVVTAAVREALAQRALAHPHVVFWADSRRRIRLFRHVIVKPNQFEALGATAEEPHTSTVPAKAGVLPSEGEVDLNALCAAAEALQAETGAAVFVTRGARGMLVVEPSVTLAAGSAMDTLDGDGASPSVPSEDAVVVPECALTLVPGVRVEGPTDPTGAGDSATAGAVLALCAGATAPEAAVVGNLVASITVQQIGRTGTASREELPARLEMWRAGR
jgi:sugar/nucleoside kinase (ribokinase family)